VRELVRGGSRNITLAYMKAKSARRERRREEKRIHGWSEKCRRSARVLIILSCPFVKKSWRGKEPEKGIARGPSRLPVGAFLQRRTEEADPRRKARISMKNSVSTTGLHVCTAPEHSRVGTGSSKKKCCTEGNWKKTVTFIAALS